MGAPRRCWWLVFLIGACGGGDKPKDPLADRPFELHVPPAYDSTKPTPLLILLHGYTEDGPMIDGYFAMSQVASDKGFLYVFPNGTRDDVGLRFWNATDGCCDLLNSKVDDVAYLKAIIKDTKARYNVDPKRVFLAGHSNGGFMSFRMACDDANEVAAIVSVAGGTWKDQSHCVPSAPVAVLDVHGDTDAIIKYDGGTFGTMPSPYPSAHETVADAAKLNGCTGALTDTNMPIDVDTGLSGSETRVERYQGCPTDGVVELWTIQGGTHFPTFASSWPTMLYDFLMAHPKR
jgi:polyhydroxybutyrate depolymerase